MIDKVIEWSVHNKFMVILTTFFVVVGGILAMLSVPFAKVVRGYSFFGVSFVYLIFEDNTDIYWARSRVMEDLNFVSGRLPEGVTPSLGPDATGVGWVYEYILNDTTGQTDLAELRSLQDWFVRYELTAVPGVSEVASIGGFVKQYLIFASLLLTGIALASDTMEAWTALNMK